MRGIKLLLAFALAGGLGASEAIAQSNPLTPLLPTNASLSRLKLTRMWWGSATLDAGRDKLLYMTLNDSLVFAHTSSGILNCFDSETGRKLWASSLGGQDEPAFPPVANETLVLIASGSTLFALNKFSGDLVWEFPMPSSPTTAPIMDETQVYLGTSDGSIMAFDLKQLSTRFNKRLSVESAGMAVRWKYKITANIYSQPVSSGEFISFAGDNRTTYTVSRGRDLRYTFDTPAPVSAGLASNRGILYVCSGDARIFALDVLTGSLKWQGVVGAPILETPRIIEDDLFVTPEGVGMFRFRARDGFEIWDRPARGVDKFVGATPDAIFGSDRLMNLVRLSRQTGEVQGALPLDRFTLRISNDLTDRLYLATPTGMIIALREPGRELPLYFKFPERLPIMPEFAPEEAVEAKPAEEKPAEEKPAEEKPAAEKPAEEKPAEEKPAAEKPAEEKAAEEKSKE